VRGEAVIEVKAGDAVLGATEGWVLENYMISSPKGKKVEGKKKK
jgi:hypothetical protein